MPCRGLALLPGAAGESSVAPSSLADDSVQWRCKPKKKDYRECFERDVTFDPLIGRKSGGRKHANVSSAIVCESRRDPSATRQRLAVPVLKTASLDVPRTGKNGESAAIISGATVADVRRVRVPGQPTARLCRRNRDFDQAFRVALIPGLGYQSAASAFINDFTRIRALLQSPSLRYRAKDQAQQSLRLSLRCADQ
jgi:hypothetical protein